MLLYPSSCIPAAHSDFVAKRHVATHNRVLLSEQNNRGVVHDHCLPQPGRLGMSWGKGVSKSCLHSYSPWIAGEEVLRWLLLTCHLPAFPLGLHLNTGHYSCLDVPCFHGQGY